MKSIHIFFAIFLICFIGLPQNVFLQDEESNSFVYEVNVIHPAISIASQDLSAAKTLVDLYKHYKPSWVREYISVKISSFQNGKLNEAYGEDDTITAEQMELMKTADVATPISVKVYYIPENTLSVNTPKEEEFVLTVNPNMDAEFPGGKEALLKYVKSEGIDNITVSSYNEYDITAIKFIVDESGEIGDVELFWKSDDSIVDDKLIDAICKMPTWTPAQYSNGLKVKQQFVLTVGNPENCIINTLNF